MNEPLYKQNVFNAVNFRTWPQWVSRKNSVVLVQIHCEFPQREADADVFYFHCAFNSVPQVQQTPVHPSWIRILMVTWLHLGIFRIQIINSVMEIRMFSWMEDGVPSKKIVHGWSDYIGHRSSEWSVWKQLAYARGTLIVMCLPFCGGILLFSPMNICAAVLLLMVGFGDFFCHYYCRCVHTRGGEIVKYLC